MYISVSLFIMKSDKQISSTKSNDFEAVKWCKLSLIVTTIFNIFLCLAIVYVYAFSKLTTNYEYAPIMIFIPKFWKDVIEIHNFNSISLACVYVAFFIIFVLYISFKTKCFIMTICTNYKYNILNNRKVVFAVLGFIFPTTFYSLWLSQVKNSNLNDTVRHKVKHYPQWYRDPSLRVIHKEINNTKLQILSILLFYIGLGVLITFCIISPRESLTSIAMFDTIVYLTIVAIIVWIGIMKCDKSREYADASLDKAKGTNAVFTLMFRLIGNISWLIRLKRTFRKRMLDYTPTINLTNIWVDNDYNLWAYDDKDQLYYKEHGYWHPAY